MKIKYIYLVLLLLVADLSISFLQYYNLPVDGDLAWITAPAPHYKDVLNDPLGLNSIIHDQLIAGAGRFSAHFTMFHYYNSVPVILQKMVTPVNSIYLASALFMVLVQLLIMVGCARLITRRKKIFHKSNLVIYALLTPLFQTNFNYDVMALIDHAPTYVFFYAWPMALFLLCYAPFYDLFFNSEKKVISLKSLAWSLPLFFYIAFGGPLIPPIALLMNSIIGIILIKQCILTWKYKSWNNPAFRSQIMIPLLLVTAYSVIALYAYYLGTYNSENLSTQAQMPLEDRYSLCVQGVLKMLTDQFGLILLIFIIVLNSILLKKYDNNYFVKYKWLLISLGLFCCSYLLLLPLGGYRPYRPFIVRYDTFIPVSLSLIFLYLHSSWNLIQTKFSFNKKYIIFLSFVTLLYFSSDLRIKHGNKCERSVLEEITNNPADTIKLINQCNVLSWQPINNASDSKAQSTMLKRWNIMKKEQLYFNYKL